MKSPGVSCQGGYGGWGVSYLSEYEFVLKLKRAHQPNAAGKDREGDGDLGFSLGSRGSAYRAPSQGVDGWMDGWMDGWIKVSLAVLAQAVLSHESVADGVLLLWIVDSGPR